MLHLFSVTSLTKAFQQVLTASLIIFFFLVCVIVSSCWCWLGNQWLIIQTNVLIPKFLASWATACILFRDSVLYTDQQMNHESVSSSSVVYRSFADGALMEAPRRGGWRSSSELTAFKLTMHSQLTFLLRVVRKQHFRTISSLIEHTVRP